ncbi:cysteine desulfurase family protein [Periweissella beninensis]|uniref:Cysteine desulfurase n=1 Tax=Periweissella beninensis TaxID=504936 RepID=A0ABT0VFU4_9LACO|nr:cysteine desulfurase family protein [Periweissella beninensis]MCM2436693.1 cysteine desulfurase [Periweissella beninensis]MCT4395659.1 cysteine desulfurase [Periweissella beninensis]
MIYFDNSATTQADPTVVDTYSKVSNNIWGNPSSLHNFGEQAFSLLNQSRKQIADIFEIKPHEVFFTSGGTEGDNWIIKGTAIEKRAFGKHLITTQIEHPAVINTMQQLESLGFEVTYLPVDKRGRVSANDVAAAIRPDTILVSVMVVNNEVGAIQPIAEIAEVLADYPKIHFHVDAVQAVGKGLQELVFNSRVDFATFSGHKFHAPRGVGFIYMKEGRRIAPLMSGGGQEKNLRSGTENLPAIAAMAKALRLVHEDEQAKIAQEQVVRQTIIEHISNQPNITVFSETTSDFAPHILTFAIEGVRGETIVHAFEEQGIYISTTSACSSKKEQVSGTLVAMKVPEHIATSAVRVSLDATNTIAEAQQFNQVFDKLYVGFEKIFVKN